MAGMVWRCPRVAPLLPHFGLRTKFTASSPKGILNKRVRVESTPHPRVANVNASRMEVAHALEVNRESAEDAHEEDMMAFTSLTSLEAQMQSLKSKGFLRAYKPYTPPADVTARLVAACSRVLARPLTLTTLGEVGLGSAATKALVLAALHREFGHLVHSSRLHEMTDLERVLYYYTSEVCTMTPYEQLHRDQEANLLPPNLVVRLDPIRFTGEGDHHLDKVTAWPRSDTLVTGLKAREKYANRRSKATVWEEEDYK